MPLNQQHDPQIRTYQTFGGVEVTRSIEELPRGSSLDSVLAKIDAASTAHRENCGMALLSISN